MHLSLLVLQYLSLTILPHTKTFGTSLISGHQIEKNVTKMFFVLPSETTEYLIKYKNNNFGPIWCAKNIQPLEQVSFKSQLPYNKQIIS